MCARCLHGRVHPINIMGNVSSPFVCSLLEIGKVNDFLEFNIDKINSRKKLISN